MYPIANYLLGGSDGKGFACHAGDLGSIPGLGRSLEKQMAAHASILAWRISWTEEPDGLQSMGRKELNTIEWLSLREKVAGKKYKYKFFWLFLLRHNMLLFLEYHNHQMFDSLLNTWLYNYWITVCMFILKLIIYEERKENEGADFNPTLTHGRFPDF